MANETMTFNDRFVDLHSYLIKIIERWVDYGKPHQKYSYFYVFCDYAIDEYKTDENGEREITGWVLKGEMVHVDEDGRVLDVRKDMRIMPDAFLGAKEITCEEYEYVKSLYDAKKNDERDLIEKVKDLINSSTDYMVKKDYLQL